jgi:deoxycytidylate deaminase
MKSDIRATTYDKRGRVISIAKNSYTKTHPIQARHASKTDQDYRIYLHAEILAIIRAKGKPIHKIRIEKQNRTELKLMKPCSICLLAIKEAGIKVIECEEFL